MLEKIMKLVNAGFTAKQIMDLVALDGEARQPTPEPAPAPAPDPQSEPAPEPAPDPKPAAPAPEPAVPDPVLAAIEKLTGTMNRFMTRSTGNVTIDDDDPQAVADNILRAALMGEKPHRKEE